MNEQDRMVIRKAVGARIRLRRKLLGLTQASLADRVGIRFQQVQKYESGSNEVGSFRLLQLAENLEVPVQYFFEDLQREEVGRPDSISEGNVLHIARVIADLPVHVQERIRKLAEEVSSDMASK